MPFDAPFEVSFDFRKELKRSFDLADVKHQAHKDFNRSERLEYTKLRKRFEGWRKAEQRAYELEYDTRFEVASKRLINKAGSKTREFTPRWMGVDRFDGEAIKRQAGRIVQASHERLMAGIDERETKDIGQLLKVCEKRTKQREKPLKDFARATDRRQKKQRRTRRTLQQRQ